ncbi:methyl-accepting chemotaxis protein [Neorhizobium alkalisoli]|uniref:Methyl-accepting chemotaxis protein n=1 Tax=Neorhizobium alkalisoli TaxID=528178 RepID=A0A561QVG7_9HYPH|nr:HAMP domain-containing methyl-accepting chemotaxis protein [Neorhizobium alkalisoli]TWF54352.1 methyl-accepting chemotaxis protein [Neorhizobium alkalisoli]
MTTATSIRKTLSVSQRLWTLGGVALAGIGTMLAISWYEGTQIDTALKHTTEVQHQIDIANELRIANLQLVLAAMDTIIDADDKQIQPERLKAINDAVSQLKGSGSTLASLATEIGKPDLVSSYGTDVDVIAKAIQSDLKTLVESGAPEAEYARLDDAIDGAGGRLTTMLTTLSAGGQAMVDRRMTHTMALASQSLYIQFGFGLLALVSVFILQSIHGGAIRRGINSIAASMTRIMNGDYATAVPGTERGDEIGEMARSTDVFRQAAVEREGLQLRLDDERQQSEARRQKREIDQKGDADALHFAVDSLAKGLNQLSEGDLSASLEKPFRQDLERLRIDFNRVTDKLRVTMAEVATNASSIGANANQMRSAADDLAKRTEKQAASLEQTSAALDQITATVRNATDRAQEASEMVTHAKSSAEQSETVVRNATAAMGRIEDATAEIGKIINVVDEIAFQTNLLALNAGVEAARAGEAGKGFAVVAQEVRELAGRAAGAAKDIKALVGRSNLEVRNGVDLVKATGEALDRIGDDVLKINDHVHSIFTSAREQSTGLTEINTAIAQMDQATQQNAAMVEQSTAASHSLAGDAENLNRLISQFQIRGNAGPRLVETAGPSPSTRPSPAHTLMTRVAGAFNNNTPSAAVRAADAAQKWEEF